MSDTPSNYHPAFPENQPPYTAAAGLPAAPDAEVAKKKLDKVHPCPLACVDKSGKPRFFSCPHNVEQHIREKHTLERPFRCEICGPGHRGFNRPFTLNRHMDQNHGVKIGPGRGNGERRAKRAAIRAPVLDGQTNGQQQFDFNGYSMQPTPPQTQADTGDNFGYAEHQCTTCKKECSDRESLFTHLHAEHGLETSPMCPCMICASIHNGGTGGAMELGGQLNIDGLGATDGAQGPALPNVSSQFGQDYDFTDYTSAEPANTFGNMLAEDLFAPRAVDGGGNVPGTQEGAMIHAKGGVGTIQSESGLQDDHGSGDLDLFYKTVFDKMDFDGMDSSQNLFDNSIGSGGTNGNGMTELIQDADKATARADQTEWHDQASLYTFSNANPAATEVVYPQL